MYVHLGEELAEIGDNHNLHIVDEAERVGKVSHRTAAVQEVSEASV